MIFKKVSFILIAILFCFVQNSHQDDYCYADDENPYIYFGSMTSYFTVRSPTSKFEKATSCTPIYTWALIKHGIKYMSEEEYEKAKQLTVMKDQIETNHVEKRDKLCEKDIENIKNWRLVILDTNQMNQLTMQGTIAEGNLAGYLKSNLNEIFQSTNSKDSYEFYTGSTKLSQDSALAFTNELLQTNFRDIKENGITTSNLVKESAEESGINIEMDSFILSDTIQNVLKEISTRLGFQQQLSYNTILSMYQVCAYESADASQNPISAFCAVFSQDDLKAFEYIQDLDHYYQYGYGSTKNERPRLLVTKDLLRKIRDAVNEKPEMKKATFYFSHTDPVSAIIKSLGLYKDDQPLKHNNYDTMKESRKWKSSVINSFTANIMAVVYRCPNNEGKKVGFYHNEKLVDVPACKENFCKLEELESAYKDVFNYEEEQGGTSPQKPEDKKDDKDAQPNKPEDKKDDKDAQPNKPEDKKDDKDAQPNKPEDKKDDKDAQPNKPEDKKDNKDAQPKKPEDKKDENSSADKIIPIFFHFVTLFIIYIFISRL